MVVEISDDGCGMSEETMGAIFDPFFTTRSNGTGLGLSIVNRILGETDHQLAVTSKEGEGSTFSLKFKTMKPPAPPAP